MMAVRADSNFGFLWRFLAIAVVFLCYSLYCLYDGFYVYPKKLKASEAYFSMDADLTSTERTKLWREISDKNGWSREKPKRPGNAKFDLYAQFVMAAGTFAIGFPCLLKFLKSNNTWVEADAKGLKTSWGEGFNFGQITSVDKSRWDVKGLAKISYLAKEGGTRFFTLDDFKYMRAPTGEILKLIEEAIPTEKILGERENSKEDASEEKPA